MKTNGYTIGQAVTFYGHPAKIKEFRRANSILDSTPAEALVKYGNRSEWVRCDSDDLQPVTETKQLQSEESSK